MGSISITRIDDLLKEARSAKSAKVCVACADDTNVLEALDAAKQTAGFKLSDFVLVGSKEKTLEAARSVNMDISECEIIDEPDAAQACKKAVAIVSSGEAQALMKGLVDTSVIMKAVLEKEAGMRTGRVLSHLAVFELPTYHKLLYVTDAAINVAPDINTKKEIIENACQTVAKLTAREPKIALLAAKEKADPKLPLTMEAAELVTWYKEGGISGCIIDGPLALDNAVSEESVKIKGISSPVGGDADILVCPNIESGNILYKSLAFLAGAKNGGVVLGAKRPVILTSRADSTESKLISIALGILS